jgi:hypothetical protein
MYPACLRGPLTAGSDGIRLWKVGGETPSQFNELCARTIPRVGSILDTFFRHHVLFTLALPVPYRLTFLPEHGVEVLLISHHGPDGPGCFIGHGHKDHIGRPPRQSFPNPRQGPLGGRSLPAPYSSGPVNQQAPYIPVAALGDTTQPTFSARGVLPRNESKPR